MDYNEGEPIIQCDTCKLHWPEYWTEGGTCIECLEIAEHGISMSEEYTFAQMVEDY